MKKLAFPFLLGCLLVGFNSARAQEQLKYQIFIEDESGVVVDKVYPNLEAVQADAAMLAEHGVHITKDGGIRSEQTGSGRQSVMVRKFTGDSPPDENFWRKDSGKSRFFFDPGNGKAFEMHEFWNDSTLLAFEGKMEQMMARVHQRLDSLGLDGESMLWFGEGKNRGKLDSLREHGKVFRFDTDKHRLLADSLRRQFEEGMEAIFSEEGDGGYFFFKSDADDDGVQKEIRVIRIEKLEHKEAKAAGVPEKSTLELDGLTIYPNPSHNRLNIQFTTEDKKAVRLRIIDMQGQEVYQHTAPLHGNYYRHEANLHQLPPGTYVLQLQQGRKNLNKKLLIE